MGCAALRLLTGHVRQCIGSRHGIISFSALGLLASSCAANSLPLATTASLPRDSRSSWCVGGAAFAALLATATASACAEGPSASTSSTALNSSASKAVEGPLTTGTRLLSLPMRQRIFFKYEKRIRDLSTLEKIFDYFATHERAGAKVMSSQDVVRALVPTYPPAGTNVERAGFLDGERGRSQLEDVQRAHKHILHFFDNNQDGTISFNEFVLIMIALSVPEKDVDIVFDIIDLDNNGVLSEEEFQQVLEQLERRAGIQATFHARAGRHHTVDTDREMAHRLFQDHTGGVNLSKFRSFLQRLQQGMTKLEFAHYDTKDRGYICGADFAHSLITAADTAAVDRYLDLVDKMPDDLANVRVSFKDFSTMAHLRQHLYLLSFALDFCYQIQRPVPREEFAKMLKKTLKMKLSPAVLDIVFYLFADSAGHLDGPGFVDVMKRRNRVPGYKKGHGLGIELEGVNSHTPVLNWFSCISACTFGENSYGAQQ